MATSQQPPKCKKLVLDAGPLLSLSPLRGLAETYVTVPQVLAELKDVRAREHFEKLGLMSGVNVEVRSPTPGSLTHVVQWSKKTGDYSVLSHADICVLALTHTLSEEAKTKKEEKTGLEASTSQLLIDSTSAESDPPPTQEEPQGIMDEIASAVSQIRLEEPSAEEQLEPLEVELAAVETGEEFQQTKCLDSEKQTEPSEPPYGDPSDEDDGEGEWITPDNVAFHKSRALDLLPDPDLNKSGKGKKEEVIDTGCMTADFAMQNVLLQMNLNLVGLEGKRIEKVKTWVLRCHACFKICKDSSKKFCPSCGNPTLLRVSVTLSSPTAASDAPIMQIHLKPNFQYRLRGTKYSIPAPKAGSARGGPGTGLILREDQVEYMRAKRMADSRREREETRMMKGIISKGIDSRGINTGVSSWMDPDWMPEIISVGAGGKGRTTRNSKMDGDMPQIGYGRKNPNEKRKKK